MAYSKPVTLQQISATQPIALVAAGAGDPVLIYNGDLSNVLLIANDSFPQIGNSVPVQPLTAVAVTDSLKWYGVGNGGSVSSVTVVPGGTQMNPSPAQIAQQIALRNINVSITSPDILSPSGDLTGATDYNNITALLAGGICRLGPGNFWVNQAIVINNNYTTLEGSLHGYGTVINAVPTVPQTGIIVLGSTASGVSQPAVKNLALKGNANAGHGIVSRAENPMLENLFIQNITGDFLHFSWDGLATTTLDGAHVSNIFGSNCTGDGLFIDTHLTESEFIAVRLSGSNAPPGFGGAYGIHNQGGANKFTDCHPFGFTNGGYFGDGDRHTQITGGSFESCGGPLISFKNSAVGCRVLNAYTYFSNAYTGTPPAQDIAINSLASWITIEGCEIAGASSNAGVETNDVKQVKIINNLIKPSIFTGAVSPHGIQNDLGSGSEFLTFDGNIVQGPGTGNSAITLGGAALSSASGNVITTADNITEGAGGANNFLINNLLNGGTVTGTGIGTISTPNIT